MGFYDEFAKKIQNIKDERSKAVSDLQTKIDTMIQERDVLKEKVEQLLIDGTPEELVNTRAKVDLKETGISMYQDRLKELEQSPVIDEDSWEEMYQEIVSEYNAQSLEGLKKVKAESVKLQKTIDDLGGIYTEARACFNMLQTTEPLKTSSQTIFGGTHFSLYPFMEEPLDLDFKQTLDYKIKDLEG